MKLKTYILFFRDFVIQTKFWSKTSSVLIQNLIQTSIKFTNTVAHEKRFRFNMARIFLKKFRPLFIKRYKTILVKIKIDTSSNNDIIKKR